MKKIVVKTKAIINRLLTDN